MGNGGLGGFDDGFYIQVHGGVVEIGIKLEKGRSADHGAGVVQQNIKPAQLLCGLFHNPLRGAWNAEVATDGNGLAAELPDGSANGFGGFSVLVVVNRNVRARACQIRGRRRPRCRCWRR